MAYVGVDHVAMWTNDMESTVRFYHDVLGMKLVRTLRAGPGYNYARHYFFDAGRDSFIAFFDGGNLPVESMSQRYDRMSIYVETKEEFDETYSRLREYGGEVTDVIDRGFGLTYFFNDPNGVRLQIMFHTKEPDFNLQGDPDPVPSVQRILSEA